MARNLRVEFEGAIHHVTVRGNNRRNLFVDDKDRVRFLERLAEEVETHNVRLYLFCLMTNHVHLIIRPKTADALGPAMRRMNSLFSAKVNRRQGWTGPTPRYTRGVMAKYARSVSSAAEGAVTN